MMAARCRTIARRSWNGTPAAARSLLQRLNGQWLCRWRGGQAVALWVLCCGTAHPRLTDASPFVVPFPLLRDVPQDLLPLPAPRGGAALPGERASVLLEGLV